MSYKTSIRNNSGDVFGDIRNYCFLDLMMTEDEATILARSVQYESELTMQDPWDILSRELIKLEDNDHVLTGSYSNPEGWRSTL